MKEWEFTKSIEYQSPEIYIHIIQHEGVLCASTEILEEYEGEW